MSAAKTLSTHICPACRNPLRSEPDGDKFTAYCAVGRCPSEMAGNGAIGDTPEQAASNLIEAMNNELDWL